MNTYNKIQPDDFSNYFGGQIVSSANDWNMPVQNVVNTSVYENKDEIKTTPDIPAIEEIKHESHHCHHPHHNLYHVDPHMMIHAHHGEDELCNLPHQDCKHHAGAHTGLCSKQHKPVGMVSHIVNHGPHIDDDKPDWHIFHNPNRKPRMFIEVIDPSNPYGPCHIKEIDRVIDISDEQDENTDLDITDIPVGVTPEIPIDDEIETETTL